MLSTLNCIFSFCVSQIKLLASYADQGFLLSMTKLDTSSC